MKVFRGLAGLDAYRHGYVSIGNFDGVHRGHRSILATLRQLASGDGLPATVLTFDPHPLALLQPGQVPSPLTTIDRKCELLAETGVDAVVIYPTDRHLLRLTPREFFDTVVLGSFDVRGLVEGPNFFFGRDRAGSIQTLHEFCTAAGRELHIVAPCTSGQDLVSSTAIRRLISDGQVRAARDLLGAAYQITGTVVRGAERGRTIGFPTANLENIATLLPRDGVYAARVLVDGTWYAAGVNLGPNPTFAEQQRKFEAHLLDFAGDLYGEIIAVEFVDRLRDTRKFDGIEDLRRQLLTDLDQVRQAVAPGPT